jgi:tetratricopeptide (TPR) repeat protein
MRRGTVSEAGRRRSPVAASTLVFVLSAGCAGRAPAQPAGQSPASVTARATSEPESAAPEATATGESAEAERGAGAALSVAPSSGDTPATPLQTGLAQGNAALAANQLEEAARHFEAAARLDPSHPAPAVGQVRVRWAKLGLPTAYGEAPNHPELQELVSVLEGILSEHPDYPPAMLEKGRLLLVLGDAERALSSLTRSVALAPNDAESHSALGVAYLATGKPELALEQLEVSAKLAPDEPERLTNLGTAYMLRGRLSEAIASYERALALRPDDARTHGDLGAAHLADDRADKALPHLLRATTLAPERATFLTNLGYAYQRQGQLDKAVETQRRALAIDPELGSAWINLGNALAELGQYDQAEVALRQAETLDPSDPRPKASLRDLAELKAREPQRRAP